jgi:hypothetical protein
VRRRGFAALKMGFIFVILLPPFRPPGTHLGAAAFGIPFVVGFIWDWLIVSGVLHPDSGAKFLRLKKVILKWAPLIPRILAVWLILDPIQEHLQAKGLMGLAYLEIGVTAFLAMGIWPRTTAILAVILVGVSQVIAPLTPGQLSLIVVYISLIFLGTGAFTLWPFEERLIHHRPGDQTNS